MCLNFCFNYWTLSPSQERKHECITPVSGIFCFSKNNWQRIYFSNKPQPNSSQFSVLCQALSQPAHWNCFYYRFLRYSCFVLKLRMASNFYHVINQITNIRHHMTWHCTSFCIFQNPWALPKYTRVSFSVFLFMIWMGANKLNSHSLHSLMIPIGHIVNMKNKSMKEFDRLNLNRAKSRRKCCKGDNGRK